MPDRGRLVVLCVVVGAVFCVPSAQAAPGPAGALSKVDSHLRELIRDQAAGLDVYREARTDRLAATPDDRVVVDVYVNADLDIAAAGLTTAGLDVVASTGRGDFRVVEGRVSPADIGDVARLELTRGVLSVSGTGTDTGSVSSAGDTSHRGPQARALGPTGAGVDVGVISNSINRVGGGVGASQASGDLPPAPRVTTLLDGPPGSNDEGRAMAEVIFDAAPGINRFFFSSGSAAGPAEKAQSIDNLRAAGVDVIADDTFMLDEPFFQDGVVAQAADRARGAGISYFASAGNRARQSYESTYRPSGADAGRHDFDPGPGDDTRQTIATVPDGGFLQVALGWDEPVGGVATDLDTELVNADTEAPLETAVTNNIATGSPNELVLWSNGTGAPVSVALRVSRSSGARAPFMKTIARGSFGTFTIGEFATDSDTINPDAASARGAIATAAVASDDAGLDTPEGFSSRGPKTRLFDVSGNRVTDVRAKPELAAADKMNTTVPGFAPFLGTSAAAPSAAGVAALLLSATPAAGAEANDADDVAAIMREPASATDCTSVAGNPDVDCGIGFLFADRTTARALDPSPPSVAPVLAPGAPTGRNGWYTGNVSVSWGVLDLGSPVTRRAGCDPVTVGADTSGTSVTCSARSAGGTGQQTVTVKRDSAAPARPSFTGIAATTYRDDKLPAERAVGCRSSDPTSGVAACVVSGYSSAAGTHTLTARATDNAGLASSATLRYTVKDVTAPRITAASLSNTTFRVRRNARAAARAKAGTTVRFRLSERGKATVTIQKRGRRNRYETLRSFARQGSAGKNSVAFAGRIKVRGKTRSLKPGRYRAVLRVVDGAGNEGRSKRLPFSVVR